MANRSYLYALNFDRTKGEKGEEGKIFGLSEYAYSIPLSYRILVSQDSKVSHSVVWEYEHPIAIQGNFEKGKQRLFDFLAQLQNEQLFDSAELEKNIAETQNFLNGRQGEYVILECGELYEMGEGELEDQNQQLFTEGVLNIESQMAGFLDHLRKVKEQGDRKAEQEMWFMLGIDYWSEILYYDLSD